MAKMAGTESTANRTSVSSRNTSATSSGVACEAAVEAHQELLALEVVA